MPKEYNKRTYVTDWNKVPIIFDIAYAANLLGMTYEYARRMCVKGIIPAHKISANSWRINKSEFMKYLGLEVGA